MTDYYVCSDCGTLRESDDRCYVCGGEEFGDYTPEYECDECGDTFDSKVGLRTHERVHDEPDEPEDEEEEGEEEEADEDESAEEESESDEE